MRLATNWISAEKAAFAFETGSYTIAAMLVRGVLALLFAGAVLAAGLGPHAVSEQPPRTNLAERLGYGPQERLLIIHADDVGVAHSVNRATFTAMDRGPVNSASIMVPCPWLGEVAEYAATHPDRDFGLHLTLTSEWKHYKWGPVSPWNRVSSLVDVYGHFYSTVQQALEQADASEAEAEIRAQVEKARSIGIEPTHLDSHMGVLFRTPELFEAYLNVGREYGIPVMVARTFATFAPHISEALHERDPVLDHLVMLNQMIEPEQWPEFYFNAIRNLQPGVTELIVHLAYDDKEMRGVTVDHPDFGSTWRQRDFDVMTSPELEAVLKEEGVRLITWREIQGLVH